MTRQEERHIAALVRQEIAVALLELMPALADRLAERLTDPDGEGEHLDAEDWDEAEDDEDEDGPENPPLPVFAVPDALRAVADWLYDALRFDGLAPADAQRRVAEIGFGEELLAEANRRRARRRLAPFGADGRPRVEEGARA